MDGCQSSSLPEPSKASYWPKFFRGEKTLNFSRWIGIRRQCSQTLTLTLCTWATKKKCIVNFWMVPHCSIAHTHLAKHIVTINPGFRFSLLVTTIASSEMILNLIISKRRNEPWKKKNDPTDIDLGK